MPKQRITKEMVVDAAFEIARKDGIEKATVKTIAEKLGCSVQPIYSYCKNMDGLKNDVAEKARTFILAEVGKPLTETTCSAAPDTHIFRLQKMNLIFSECICFRNEKMFPLLMTFTVRKPIRMFQK